MLDPICVRFKREKGKIEWVELRDEIEDFVVLPVMEIWEVFCKEWDRRMEGNRTTLANAGYL